MDLKQLRSFIAVANTLNFGRAARQLYLSQSALSIQIQNLETHLGVPLFERNRRSVRLTAAGEAVLADSEELLQRIANIELRARQISSGEVGHLRIGFVASATASVIPAIVLAFRKLYPGVALDLKSMPTVQQIDALKSGSIDVGVVRLPVSVDGLSVDSIHQEPFAIVLPKAHPLASEKALTVRQLANEPFIAYGRKWAPSFYDHWTLICREAGFSPNGPGGLATIAVRDRVTKNAIEPCNSAFVVSNLSSMLHGLDVGRFAGCPRLQKHPRERRES